MIVKVKLEDLGWSPLYRQKTRMYLNLYVFLLYYITCNKFMSCCECLHFKYSRETTPILPKLLYENTPPTILVFISGGISSSGNILLKWSEFLHKKQKLKLLCYTLYQTLNTCAWCVEAPWTVRLGPACNKIQTPSLKLNHFHFQFAGFVSQE